MYLFLDILWTGEILIAETRGKINTRNRGVITYAAHRAVVDDDDDDDDGGFALIYRRKTDRSNRKRGRGPNNVML